MKEWETWELNQNWQIMPKIYLPFGTLQCEEQKGLFVLRGKIKDRGYFCDIGALSFQYANSGSL